jgi:ATPase inhibitor, mitochondrial
VYFCSTSAHLYDIYYQEQRQLSAIRDQLRKDIGDTVKEDSQVAQNDKDFEGGFGGQEDLEDRYATTSGEH